MATTPIPTLERPAFFDGQRLTAADLAAAVEYELELRRLHNRALHGWGIALGFPVVGGRGATSVSVGPGLALDSLGRELVLGHSLERPVPPLAQASTWYLTISYAADPHLSVEERDGVCGAEGAVRLSDEPLVRWLDAQGKGEERLRPGLDLVLAVATVRGCQLDGKLDLSQRRQLLRPQPYVYTGRTEPGATRWKTWAQGGEAGVTTTVSTAQAGFLSTPTYQARLDGSRVLNNAVVDGFAAIVGPSSDSFEFRVTLPKHQDLRATGPGGTMPLNKSVNVSALRTKLNWHVVWMGVES
ncbi:MAG TPA: hypothetical protein VGH35_04275 [Gaiellaceae bacterium]